jgi:hypothetical protein
VLHTEGFRLQIELIRNAVYSSRRNYVVPYALVKLPSRNEDSLSNQTTPCFHLRFSTIRYDTQTHDKILVNLVNGLID